MNLWLIPPLTLAALAAGPVPDLLLDCPAAGSGPPPRGASGGLRLQAGLAHLSALQPGAEQRHRLGAGPGPLARAGHTVTVNYPSPVLQYDPMEYDLLIFGGSAYMGEVGRPLKNYLSSLRFSGKKVLLFVVGELERAPEMAGLRLCVPAGNQVRSIKIRPGQEKQLSNSRWGSTRQEAPSASCFFFRFRVK